MYEPRYRSAWALVVGIDKYEHVSPLQCARRDAERVASELATLCGFPTDNITLLLDAEATRDRILEEYLALAGDKVDVNDKVLVFFAGHGCTKSGKRGEVGYLIPVDGAPERLESMVRWDEFTRNADLIPAKHIVFIMDACYGGLAVSRSVGPGAMRFLKSMLQRHARQVLTAGKADETVADSGGPIVGHSMFTGHFLQAIQGAAATDEGVITATGVMAHVYTKVANDPYSQQTPHYGCVDGDGDFIFAAPDLSTLGSDDGSDEDILVRLPVNVSIPEEEIAMSLSDRIKVLLAEPANRIKLDDITNELLRKALAKLEESRLPTDSAPIDAEAVAARIVSYEHAVSELSVLMVLLGKWGTEGQVALIPRVLTRIADVSESSGGYVVWIGLQWYPVSLLMYYAGIAALSADNYQVVGALFRARAASTRSGTSELVFGRANSGLAEANDGFKLLPGHEKHYVPRSEHMFKTVQPLLEDELFLGRGFEEFFDRFEILNALAHADRDPEAIRWGPVGRFGWKANHSERNPLDVFGAEAFAAGEAWPVLRTGLFGASASHFREVFQDYRGRLRGVNFF